MGGGPDSMARSGSECLPVVDCKFWGTSTYINGKVFCHSYGEIWGDGQRQFQVSGAAIDKKMQNA
jgi:hypothetical protein